MPTYEFRCPKGHEFEKFYRSIGSATGEVTCPVCGEVGARQLSAGGGLVFKGSGFYITDYGKDGKKSQTAPAVAADSGSGDSGSSDAAAATPATGEGASKADTTPSAAPAGEAKPAASEGSKPAATPKPAAKKTSPGKASKSE